MYRPFKLVRLPRRAGRDMQGDMFCVAAVGNPELVKSNESAPEALINGAAGSDTAEVRQVAEKVVAALNEVWDKYMRGEFHDDAPPIAAGVVCKCPADFCPMHGRRVRAQ